MGNLWPFLRLNCQVLYMYIKFVEIPLSKHSLVFNDGFSSSKLLKGILNRIYFTKGSGR
jgi:hypothetical protein